MSRQSEQFYRLNPDLREYFESLPISLKNIILESGAEIDTLGELKLCAEHLQAGNGGDSNF